MKTREELFTVYYKRHSTTNTLPIYAPSKERAVEMAVSFGKRSRCMIVGVEQADFYVLRFGVVLPKTIYV